MQLKTPRLILRKPKLSDWKDIVEGAGEYDVAKMVSHMPHPYKKSDAEQFIERAIKNWGKGVYAFFIELKSEKKVIGGLGLRQIDKFNGTASTGSWINKKYWRQGYMTEAKIAVNDFAFDKQKLRRLNSTVYAHNKASNATQIKVGYKFEGCRKKSLRSLATGKVYDENMYGLLKEDWKKARVRLLDKR